MNPPDAMEINLHRSGWATDYLNEMMATKDAHEGLAAFLEKRAPEWNDN